MKLIGKYTDDGEQYYIFRGLKSYDGTFKTHIYILKEVSHIIDKEYRIELGKDVRSNE